RASGVRFGHLDVAHPKVEQRLREDAFLLTAEIAARLLLKQRDQIDALPRKREVHRALSTHGIGSITEVEQRRVAEREDERRKVDRRQIGAAAARARLRVGGFAGIQNLVLAPAVAHGSSEPASGAPSPVALGSAPALPVTLGSG